MALRTDIFLNVIICTRGKELLWIIPRCHSYWNGFSEGTPVLRNGKQTQKLTQPVPIRENFRTAERILRSSFTPMWNFPRSGMCDFAIILFVQINNNAVFYLIVRFKIPSTHVLDYAILILTKNIYVCIEREWVKGANDPMKQRERTNKLINRARAQEFR